MYFKLTDYQTDDEVWDSQFRSSHIDAIAYDSYRMTLVVKYLNGDQYLYSGMPPSVYDRLMMAGSKGKFLFYHVKGHYPSTKIVDNAQ